MKRKSFTLLNLIITFMASMTIEASSQQGKLYISVYGDSNYAILFSLNNGNGFIIANTDSEHSKSASITKLEIKQFKNAIRKVLEIRSDTLINISYDLLNQINLDLAKNEIAKRFEEQQLKENVPIGLLSFRNKDRIVPLLITPRRDEWRASKASIPAVTLAPGSKDTFKIALTGKYGKFSRLDTTLYRFAVSSVEIAIEDGAMKDILIKGKLLPEQIDIFFQNTYAISISTPRHITNVNTRGNNLFRYHGDGREFYIDFADVIKYDRIVAMGSGHYVPRNGVIKLSNTAQEPITLVKNPFFDNFDVRIYTDVTGLQKENPNGLIQTEGQYNILLNTKPLGPYSRFFRNISVFNKISPIVKFSKIENKLNDLPLETVARDSLSFNRANSVDLLRYANLNIGIDINVVSWIGSHTKFRLNGLMGLYRTSVDSSSLSVLDNGRIIIRKFEPRNVLSWYAMPLLSAQMIDGDKLDFDVSIGAIFLRLFDENISLGGRNAVQRYQMNLNIHPNTEQQDKSIFFRTTFFYTGKSHNNLSLQLGYSTPISKLF